MYYVSIRRMNFWHLNCLNVLYETKIWYGGAEYAFVRVRYAFIWLDYTVSKGRTFAFHSVKLTRTH